MAGKIVACERGVSGRVEKGGVVKAAGATGMILANNAASGDELLADPHLLPATMVTYTDGLKVFAYINSTRSVLIQALLCIHQQFIPGQFQGLGFKHHAPVACMPTNSCLDEKLVYKLRTTHEITTNAQNIRTPIFIKVHVFVGNLITLTNPGLGSAPK